MMTERFLAFKRQTNKQNYVFIVVLNLINVNIGKRNNYFPIKWRVKKN